MTLAENLGLRHNLNFADKSYANFGRIVFIYLFIPLNKSSRKRWFIFHQQCLQPLNTEL